jgi:hypothetical protein
MEKLFAECHFTDELVEVMIYLGNGYYKVMYPAGDVQAAHESTLNFDYYERTA